MKKLICLSLTLLLVVGTVFLGDFSAFAMQNSESAYRGKLEAVCSDTIVDFAYEDFDADGTYEAFATTAGDLSSAVEGYIKVDIWFVTDSGAKKIYANLYASVADHDKPGVMKVLENNDNKFIVVSAYSPAHDNAHIWYVKNGNAVYDSNASGKGIGGIKCNDEYHWIEGSCLADDYSITDREYTEKIYYFYFDDGLKEYGGIQINKNDIYQINGETKIIDWLAKTGGRIQSIFARENGIININYRLDIDDTNNNLTLLYCNGGLKIIEYNIWGENAIERSDQKGIYAAAMVPAVATFPNGITQYEDANGNQIVTDSVLEHINFINNNSFYNNTIKNNDFAAEMAGYKGSAQYNWQKFLSFDFDNYYKIVLTDLILKETNSQKVDDLAIDYVEKEEFAVANELAKDIKLLIDQSNATSVTKIEISQNEIYKFLHDGFDENSQTYKILTNFFKNNESMQNSMKAFLVGMDKASALTNFINVGVDTVNEIVHCKNYLVSINAYTRLSEAYKKMLVDVKNEIGSSNNKLKEALENYINADSNTFLYASEVFSACSVTAARISHTVMKGLFLKQVLSKIASYAANIPIHGTSVGALIAEKISGVTVGTIFSSLSSINMGLQLGVGISQFLTNASQVSSFMGCVVAVGELTPYIKTVMLRYANNVLNSRNPSDIALFEEAYGFYKDCEIYAIECTANAIEAEGDAFLFKVFFPNRAAEHDDLYEELICDAGELNHIYCHKHDISLCDYDVFALKQIAFASTGKEITPKIDRRGWKENTDYKITYDNNVKSGLASVTITGIGWYLKGSVTYYFRIYDVSFPRKYHSNEYDLKPIPTIKYKDTLLKNGVDFDLSYSGILRKTSHVIVSFKNNHSGEMPIEIPYDNSSDHIRKATVTQATLTANGSKVYKCSVCGKTLKTETIYAAKNISISKNTYTYNGKAQKPTVTIKDSKGNKIATSNYTITYSSGCKNVGKYSVKITFKGDYKGSKTFNFTINPKNTSITNVTSPKTKQIKVTIKKYTTQTTGYEIQYSTDKNFKKGNKTVALTSNNTTTKTITGLKANTVYYVRIRTYKTVSNAKYYSGWSKAKSVKTKKKNTKGYTTFLF